MVPGAMLLGGFQRLLQPHSGRGQKASGRLFHRQSVHLYLELLLVGHFGGAILAARDVLLQLVPRIVSQLVVQIQRDVLLHPFAIHNSYLLPLTSRPSVRRATSAFRGTACSSRSLPSYSKPRRSSSASAPGSASFQKPCARAELAWSMPWRFALPARAASGRARGWRRNAHRRLDPAGCSCRRPNRS